MHCSFAVICVWVAQFVFVYSILGDVGDILDAWGVLGHLFGRFRMSWASSGGLGAAWGSHLQSEEKKLQKMTERRAQYGRLGGPWCPPWVHRVSLLQPCTATKSSHECSKDEFGDILKIVLFLVVFNVFGG